MCSDSSGLGAPRPVQSQPHLEPMMATSYTIPKDGEHVIGYAYPNSDTARAMAQAHGGCFAVRLFGDAKVYTHATYVACVAHVATTGTRPGRWSMDHPQNQHLYVSILAGLRR